MKMSVILILILLTASVIEISVYFNMKKFLEKNSEKKLEEISKGMQLRVSLLIFIPLITILSVFFAKLVVD